MPRPALALAAAALLCAACVAAHRDGLCPESRSLACLTQEQCAPDASRGCLVCTCTGWDSPPAREGGAAAARPEGDSRPPPVPAQ